MSATPMLQPDPASTQKWIETWFKHCNLGAIAVAWSDPYRGGAIYNERLFDLHDPGIGQFCAERNAVENVNVYYVASTVDPVAHRKKGRSTDEHVVQAPGAWVDQDTPEHVERANVVPLHIRTPYYVVTGTQPTLRLHRYLPFVEPLVNKKQISEFNKRLLAIYGGDPKVTNPSSLMRMPGTIAWPFKSAPIPGRVPELVTWNRDPNVAESNYNIGYVNSSLPRLEQLAPISTTGDASTSSVVGNHKPTVQELRAFLRTSEMGRHLALLQLTGHYVARGLSNEEILDLTRDFGDVPGHLGDAKLPDEWKELVLKEVESAREKWKHPEQDRVALNAQEQAEAIFAGAPPLPALAAPSLPSLGVAHYRPLSERIRFPNACGDIRRGYLWKGVLAPGDVAAIVGQPGAGKSVFAPYLGYAIAQGRTLFGQRVRQCRVLYAAAEDYPGMSQRITTLYNEFGDTKELALCSCNDLNGGGFVELQTNVKEWQPKLLIIDTLNAAWAGINENAPDQMGVLIGQVRALAAMGCAVVLVHHPAKDGDGTARGHSSLNGTLDVVLQLKRGDAGQITWRTTKNRNGPSDHTRAFRIVSKCVGNDEDGEKVWAPLLLEEATCMAAPCRKAPSPLEQRVFGILMGLMAGSPHGIKENELVEACCREGVSTSPNPENQKRAVRKAMRELLSECRFEEVSGLLRPAGTVAFPPLPGTTEPYRSQNEEPSGTSENQAEPAGTIARTTSQNHGTTGTTPFRGGPVLVPCSTSDNPPLIPPPIRVPGASRQSSGSRPPQDGHGAFAAPPAESV